eukprot:scaffold143431_cov20-Prasinocladus_malaysianus.AAC.1
MFDQPSIHSSVPPSMHSVSHSVSRQPLTHSIAYSTSQPRLTKASSIWHMRVCHYPAVVAGEAGAGGAALEWHPQGADHALQCRDPPGAGESVS